MATLRTALKQLHPLKDSIENNQIADVIGNKTDSSSVTVSNDTKSLITYLKSIWNYVISVFSYTAKIDSAATLGLVGTYNSAAYRIHELEKHFHNYERWFGLAVIPNGTIHRADALSLYTNIFQIQPFQIISGNDNYGLWVQVLGSADTPFYDGNVYYDFHKVQIVDSGSTNEKCVIQCAWGDDADAAVLNKDYSTFTYLTPTNQAAETGIDVMMPRVVVGTKIWMRCLAIDDNAITLDFYIGEHGYQG